MFQHFYINFYSDYLSGIVWIMGEWEIMETYPYMPSCHIYDRIVQVNCRNVHINCRIVLKFSRFLCMANSLHFRETLKSSRRLQTAWLRFVLFWFWFWSFFAASGVSCGDSLASSSVVKGVVLQAEVAREVMNTMFIFIFNLPRYELSSLIKPPNTNFLPQCEGRRAKRVFAGRKKKQMMQQQSGGFF